MKSIVDEARNAKIEAIKLRDEKPPKYGEAAALLNQMLIRIEQELVEYRKDSPAQSATEVEGKIAQQGVHLYGSLGGIYRRWGKLDESIAAYAAGAKLETDPRYPPKETYASTQLAVLRCLANPSLIAEAAAVEESNTRRELTLLRARIVRLCHGDVYKTADLAVVSLLLCHPEWRTSLRDFVTMAKKREDEYALKVTFEVIQELTQRAKSLPPATQESLSHWEEAAHWPV